jgi:predicted phosphodiesterase
LGVISDIHCAPDTAAPYAWQNTVDLPHSIELLDAALDWLAGQRLDALALLGDLTEAADAESFGVVRERALALGVPVVAVPGNCDVDPVDRSLTAFEETRGERLAVSPGVLRIPSGGLLELVHLAGEQGSTQLRGVRPSIDMPWPEVRIVLTHYPVLPLAPELTRAGFRHSGDLTNRAAFERELREPGRPVIVVHGHLHIHDTRASGALLQLSCGPLIEAPHLVSTIDLEVNDERVAVHRTGQSVREDEVERLPIFTPLNESWTWNGQQWTADRRA